MNKVLEFKNDLRKKRELECFTVINRGKLWYERLSYEQYIELVSWYNKWLDVTNTLVIPERPNWLDKKLNNNDEVL